MPTPEWSFETPCEYCQTAVYCRRHLYACAAFANFLTYGGRAALAQRIARATPGTLREIYSSRFLRGSIALHSFA